MNVLTPSGTPDGTTALLTATGCMVAYGNANVDIEFFIGAAGGGTYITKGGIATNVFRPNWFLWGQGNTLFAQIAGTDLLPSLGAHIWSDIGGYFFTSEQRRNEFYWHSFFHDAAVDIARAVLAELQSATGSRWTKQVFAGHSYGAAVAQSAAWITQASLTTANVGCIGWGSPKPAFCRPSEPLLRDACMLNADLDPVGYQPSVSPPVGTLPGADIWTVVFGTESLSWRHLCPVWSVAGANIVLWNNTGQQTQSFPPSISFAAHSMTGYRDAVRDYRRRQLGE